VGDHQGQDGIWLSLDSDPSVAENLTLRQGDQVAFGSQHVIDTGRPPHDYIVEKYGASFFED
jgi:hypothetical protein